VHQSQLLLARLHGRLVPGVVGGYEMNSSNKTAVGVVVLALPVMIALGVVGAAGALRGPASKVAMSRLSAAEQRTLAHVSAPGVPVALPAGDFRTTRLAAAGYSGVSRLATRGGTSFFRVQSSSGHDCFGSGPAAAAWPFSAIVCSTRAPFFPSAANPLLDQSLVGADSPTEALHFLSLQGVAADGVVAVKGLDSVGNVVVTAPVNGNVYYETGAQMPSNVIAIEAVDGSGNVLQTLPHS
jgi:hypothetical protein